MATHTREDVRHALDALGSSLAALDMPAPSLARR
jgi:hypothetical protein